MPSIAVSRKANYSDYTLVGRSLLACVARGTTKVVVNAAWSDKDKSNAIAVSISKESIFSYDDILDCHQK